MCGVFVKNLTVRMWSKTVCMLATKIDEGVTKEEIIRANGGEEESGFALKLVTDYKLKSISNR